MLFLTFLIACAAAAATGQIFKPDSWYDELVKPPFTPPNWVFPAAWGLLYILIAWAAARLAVRPGTGFVLALWAAQIALNTLWTPVFFAARKLTWSLGIMAMLWAVVLVMAIVTFWHDLLAGLVFLAYLGWLSFAATLNLHIWQDNRDSEAA